MTKQMKQSLTQAIYNLKLAIEYMDDYKRDCRQFEKHQAGMWSEKLKQVQVSIYNALTPDSRELFKREIEGGDIFVYPAIATKLMQLAPDKRDEVESMIDVLLSGGTLTIEGG